MNSGRFFCYHPGSHSSPPAKGTKQGLLPSPNIRQNRHGFVSWNYRERRSVHNSTGAGLFFKCLCSESGHSFKSVLIISGITDGKDLWGHLSEHCLWRIHLHTILPEHFLQPSWDVPEDCASSLSLRSQFQNPHAVHFRLKMRLGWGSIFNYPKHWTEA